MRHQRSMDGAGGVDLVSAAPSQRRTARPSTARLVARRGAAPQRRRAEQSDAIVIQLVLPIDVLGLTTPVRRALGRSGIRTLADLTRLRRSEVALMRRIGPRSLAEIEHALARVHLRLIE